MQAEIATLVQRVVTYGLDLKERLENGGAGVLDLEQEQAALKGHLLSDNAARQYADYGGDGEVDRSALGGAQHGDVRKPGTGAFLGIRYALTCWLDEMFIFHSPWGNPWKERTLERALYGTNDGAFAFWDQARRAEGRSGSDAPEGFFLCVMLGFRGQWRNELQKLQAWVSALQTRITKSQGPEFQLPPELDPPSDVPPLHGRQRFQSMLFAAAATFWLLVPITACWLFVRIYNR